MLHQGAKHWDTELGGKWIFPRVMVGGAIGKKKLKNAIGTPGNSYNGRRRPGMDLCACFTSVDAARRELKIIENEFKRYGSILSRPKTESMTLNHDEETIKSESLISLDEEKIKNVLEFKYLGHIIKLFL